MYINFKKIVQKYSFQLFLGLLWLTCLLLIDPRGNFPLNDDWSYARSVYDLLEKGEFILVDWGAMTLIAQVYIGAFFCKVFGLSFTVLRASTLCMSLIGALAFYGVANELTKRKELAQFSTLVLFFNPMYFNLSYTFMTDVHFLSFFLLAFLFFIKNLRQATAFNLAAATLFSVIATLIRQPGLLIPFIFLFISFFQTKRQLKERIADFIPAVLTLGIFITYNIWLKWGTSTPNNVQSVTALYESVFARSLAYNYFRLTNIILYVGLFLSPFLVGFLAFRSKLSAKRIGLLGTIGLTLLVLFYQGSSFFPTGNILYNLGLGPQLLRDTYLLKENIAPSLAPWAMSLIKYIAVLASAGLFLAVPWSGISPWKTRKTAAFSALWLSKLALGLCLLILGIFLLIIPYFFDRYTLPLVACSLLLLLPYEQSFSRWSIFIGGFFLILFAGYSVLGTHYYLAWNRVRWEAMDYLLQEKQTTPEHIDAGFEVNAWLEAGPVNGENDTQISWWFVTEDDYVLTFGTLPDFQVEKVFPIKGYWPFNGHQLYVLWHKVNGFADYEDFPVRCDAEQLSDDQSSYLSNVPSIRFDHLETQSDTRAHTGQYSIGLTDQKEYAASTTFKRVQPGDEFTVRIWRWDPTGSAALVLSDKEGQGFYHFTATNIIQKEENGWEQLELKATIPADASFQEIGINIWHQLRQDAWFDDLEIFRTPANHKDR